MLVGEVGWAGDNSTVKLQRGFFLSRTKLPGQLWPDETAPGNQSVTALTQKISWIVKTFKQYREGCKKDARKGKKLF